MPELHVLTGEGREETIALGDVPVSFGRADECDVTLSEHRASRRHCTFLPEEKGGWRVVDEGSSNGTFLGGRPILAARLKPGDELEIGMTVITFVAESVQPTRVRRGPQPRRPAWGLLVMPVVFAIAAFLGVGAYESASAANRTNTWENAARRTIERVDMPAQAGQRAAILRAFRDEIPDAAVRARRVIDAAIASAAAPAPDRSAWSGPVSDLRGKWGMLSSVERRTRLRQLLDRHAEVPEAVEEIRDLLERYASEDVERSQRDRERTQRKADEAVDEGRLGDALDLWNGWAMRSPVRERDVERAVAAELEEIAGLARAAADQALAESRTLAAAARLDDARDRITLARDALRGTGWDAWLVARTRDLRRGTDDGGGGSGSVVIERGSGPAEAQVLRERAAAVRALSAAEDLARMRSFKEAARRLEQALPEITDTALRADLELRLADLRAEFAVVQMILAQVRDAPRKFGPLDLDGSSWKVNGATEDGLMVSYRDEVAVRSLSELPTDAMATLVRRATLRPTDARPAALLLWDVGARAAYTELVRNALDTEDDVDRNETSALHARLHGRTTPDGGYVPHPDKGGGVISYDEFKALQNAAKIAEFAADLERIATKVETSKQAKQLARVAEAYARLETARQYALELIFDEVKYFYPYRDRMGEYTPVSREVDVRVGAVRAAWDDEARARPRRDSALDKLLQQAEDVAIEMDYLGGDSQVFTERIERVTRYLDRDLTVRTWFETQSDLRVLEYNDLVLQENAAMDTVATGSEREQVRITNEYRIMFGHRVALRINDQLTLSSRGHSDDMARVGFFDHFSPVPGKRTPGERMRAAGYIGAGGSENIHRGASDPRGAHESWAHSSGHHRNILMPAWREMGTGQSGRHWTQNFGFRGIEYGD